MKKRMHVRFAAAVIGLALAVHGRTLAQGVVSIDESFSPEVVVRNSASGVTLAEAYSQVAAAYNSETAGVPGDAYSRTAATYNSDQPAVFTQAYSREPGLYNSQPAVELTQAYSKEAALFLSESPIVDTFSREAAVYDGYHIPEAGDALRIAAGIAAATPANMDRFALGMQLAGAARIDLPTAAIVLRIAAQLSQ